jgi:hypothetical protein
MAFLIFDGFELLPKSGRSIHSYLLFLRKEIIAHGDTTPACPCPL